MALTKQQLYNLRESNIYPNNNKEIDAVMLAEFQDNFINSIWAYVDTRRLVDLYDIRTAETLIDNTIYGLRWNAVQEDWSFAIGGGTGIQEGTEDGQTTVWDNDISAWLPSDLLKILEGGATLNTNLTVVDGTINADNILISDNLGVGTNEPNRPIHIQGDGHTYMTVDSSTEDNRSGYLMGVNGTWEGIMRYNDEHKFLGIGVRDHTDTLVTAGGNVAIGTTDPDGARLRIMMSNDGHIRFNDYGSTSARMDVAGTFYLNYAGSNFRIASDGTHHSEFNNSGDLYVLDGDVHADDFITNSKVASKEENALSKLDNIDEWLDSDNNIQYEKHYAYKETVASDDDNKDRVRKGLSMETRVAMLEKMVYELSTELKKYR